MTRLLFNFLIFPGFLFTAIVGLIASWIDRKVTARIQWRVGPPWYQPLIDLVKLSIKEITVPRSASKGLFFLSPMIGLSAVTFVSTLIWLVNIDPVSKGFSGDIIVIMYLLTLPAIAIILGASSSGNPLASLGASREIKLVMAYELPFIICLIVPVIKSHGLLRLSEIINYQAVNGSFIASLSGIIAFIVMIFCMQAKLGLVPFDASEAETEIMGGALIEYSGMLLAIFKLTKTMLMVALPLFLITLFWQGFNFLSIWKYVVLLVIIVLIRNTNPRVRVDQAVRFFWGKMTLMAILAVLLAIKGM
ncbi:MAG: NADH-quinone oxidoreductase subunit H [Candidatus Omnitrophica bacterium]|nr:NADH-quinone oxidoreductase subunit H [Candidatus Omnitrophota bacterium]